MDSEQWMREERAQIEQEADLRRAQEGEGSYELEGDVLARFRDWAVTTVGVESLVSGYGISYAELGPAEDVPGPESWEMHMLEKTGEAHGSYADFLKALANARLRQEMWERLKLYSLLAEKQRRASTLPRRTSNPTGALETRYNGYRFRSRLEARWAVFMDTLGVEYRYEPEGFDLGDSIRYLPDFWLPAEGAWVEIKPTKPTSAETDKAQRLATMTGHRVYLCFGDVWLDEVSDCHYVCYGAREELGGEVGGDDFQKWTECPRCGYVGFAYSGWSRNLRCPCPDEGKRPNAHSPRLLVAYQAARSARFEFGESGR